MLVKIIYGVEFQANVILPCMYSHQPPEYFELRGLDGRMPLSRDTSFPRLYLDRTVVTSEGGQTRGVGQYWEEMEGGMGRKGGGGREEEGGRREGEKKEDEGWR